MKRVEKYFDRERKIYCIEITETIGMFKTEHIHSIELDCQNNILRGTCIEYGETRELNFAEIVKVIYDNFC